MLLRSKSIPQDSQIKFAFPIRLVIRLLICFTISNKPELSLYLFESYSGTVPSTVKLCMAENLLPFSIISHFLSFSSPQLFHQNSDRKPGSMSNENQPMIDMKSMGYNSVQGRFIQKMFSEASMQIFHMLEKLSNLYKHYSIKYEVIHCYDMLIRMLTPYELLTYFNLKTPYAMLNQQFINRFSTNLSTNLSTNFSTPQYTPNLNISSKHQYNIFNYPDMEHSKNMIRPNVFVQLKNQRAESIQHSEKNVDTSIHSPADSVGETRTGKNNGGRPILQMDEEISVQNFIRNQVSKGVTLTMPQIAKEAKRISKGRKNFMASLGWVKNFMKRYPEMRDLYQYSRFGKNAVRFPNSVKISQYISQQQTKVTSDPSQFQRLDEMQYQHGNESEGQVQRDNGQSSSIFNDSGAQNIYDDELDSNPSGTDQISRTENGDTNKQSKDQSEKSGK